MVASSVKGKTVVNYYSVQKSRINFEKEHILKF